MTELEIAASDWKQLVEQVEIGHHPSVWISHYRGVESLGSVHITDPQDEALAVLILGSPFAVSHVLATFVFVDRPNQVLVSRLSFEYREGGEGVYTTHWRLPYSVGDRFAITFGVAEKQPHPVERIERALSDLAAHRLRSGQYDFNTAFWHSVARGKGL